ncbi:MAG: hypothetical protein AAF501_15230, partial [Pseudomonadota bacterium]
MAAPETDKPPQKKSVRRKRVGFWLQARTNFLTGLVVVAPVVLTIYLTWAIITFIDAQIVPLVPSIYNPSTYI